MSSRVAGPLPQQPWVLVVGMHRSGTSAVTGALGATGLRLNRDDDRMDWAESNPEHWESLSLTVYDEDLLERLGGSWDAPPELVGDWPHATEFDGLPDPVAALAGAFPGPGPSVWKDPRLCLLLPFWREVLAGPLTAVLVWRSPAEVARSLHRRDGIPLADGLALWERYNRAAIAGLDGVATYVLDYDSVVRDPDSSLSDLLSWLGSLDQLENASKSWDHSAPASSIAGELRHHADRVDGEGPSLLLAEQTALVDHLAGLQGGHAKLNGELPVGESPWTTSLLGLRRRMSEPNRERDAALDLLRLSTRQFEAQLDGAHLTIQHLRGSTSWKVTRPLRSLTSTLERRRSRSTG